MSESKESRHHQRKRRLVEDICAKMEQVMDSKFKALRQEIQQPGHRQTQPAPKEYKPFTAQQTSPLPNRLDKSKTYDDLERQIREAFKAVAKSKKKNTKPQPSSKVDSISQAKCILPSSKLELVLDNKNTCSELTPLKPVQPSSIESLSQVQEEVQPEESPRSYPLIMDVKQQPSHEPEQIPKPLTHHHPKHCKETSVFNVKPNLFVLVSAQEEKRFGLENVKEFCVSRQVFDKMTPSFETFELDFLSQNGFKTSNLFKSKDEFVFARTFSKVKPLIENSFCVPIPFSDLCEPISKDHVFDNRISNLVQSHLFASKIKSLFTLGSKEYFCVNQCYNAVLDHDTLCPLLFDHTDIIHLYLSKELYAGFRETIKHNRRIQRWEEDKRFKPPDLDQNKHQAFSFFIFKEAPPDLDQGKHPVLNSFQLVKEAPPDGTYKLKPSQNRFEGKSLSLQNSVITNLPYVHADCLDLRTNPFQVGGDDVILTSTKEMQHGPELEPAPDWPITGNTRGKIDAEEFRAALTPFGPMTRTKTRMYGRTHAQMHAQTHVLIWAIDF